MPLPNTVPLIGIGWDDVLFVVLAAVVLGSALLVVTMRDIIRCGLAMIACFAGLAGIYVLLGAPLVAATQVLVYIGAISVLVLFAIMLTQTKNAPNRLVFQTQWWAALIAAVALAMIIAVTAAGTSWPNVGERAWSATTQVSDLLFHQYVLPFEAVSVLLTAAVVGGVFLARRETTRHEEEGEQ